MTIRLNFKIIQKDPSSQARVAELHTRRGPLLTPVFMPVGTQATVKSQTVDSIQEVGSTIVLANTYHLLLRPGPEVLKKIGGIHRFMNWNQPVLTDSGGFQIFSLPHARKIDESGARFTSYIDQRSILLTPESCIQMQKIIQSDIMMVLDHCIPSTSSYSEAKSAMELTHRWAKRCLNERGNTTQALFAIVQGACYPDLRKISALSLQEMKVHQDYFDGFAIGGLAVGESKQQREDFCQLTADHLPHDRPRYLMGVGTPLDILEAVYRGVDMFDCILPSQLAQRGTAFTSVGKIQLRRTAYAQSELPLDPNCSCKTCTQYSRAYLHHLYKAQEYLGWHLLAYHNFYFYHSLMARIRAHILNGSFESFYRTTRNELCQSDPEHPSPTARRTSPTPRLTRSEKNKTVGDYELIHSPLGHFSVRQKSSGEIMHSVIDPDQEAQNLYIKTACFEALMKTKTQLTIWDVGLGAAHNAMAAIRHLEPWAGAPHASSVNLISFERDLDPLRLALKNPGVFKHIRHPAPHRLLSHQSWTSQDHRIRWQLHLGDFEKAINSVPPADVIFYDPFSEQTNPELWEYAIFKKIYAIHQNQKTQLLTYSASTRLRAVLLSLGYYVAYGPQTGPKSSTTIAWVLPNTLTRAPELSEYQWLDSAWLERLKRSTARLPPEVQLDRVFSHPQFSHAPFLKP